MKVDFIIIGAMKCGTTTLAEIISRHPDISFSKIKEPNFFSETSKWKENIQEYHNLFDQDKNKLYGEASTTYSIYPHKNLNIWNDIFEYNNNMKFLYVVRNPIDRIKSHFMMRYHKGRIDCSIEEMIISDPRMINTSRYYTQIKPFIDKFGKNQVCIIDFEDLINKREIVFSEIAEFLGIDENKYILNEEINKNNIIDKRKLNYRFDKPVKNFAPIIKFIPVPIKNFLRRILTNPKRVFKEKPKLKKQYQEIIINQTFLDTIELSKLTGKDFSNWLQVDSE